MTPAEVVVDAFNGISQTAKALGVEYIYVWRWLQPHLDPVDGKTSGRIPSRYHVGILQAAKSRGIHLTLEHLTFGKPDMGRVVVRCDKPAASWMDVLK